MDSGASDGGRDAEALFNGAAMGNGFTLVQEVMHNMDGYRASGPDSATTAGLESESAERVRETGSPSDSGSEGEPPAAATPDQSGVLLREFEPEMELNGEILNAVKGYLEELPAGTAFSDRVITQIVELAVGCLQEPGDRVDTHTPDELLSQVGLAIREALLKHVGADVAERLDAAVRSVENILYDEMIFNRVIQQVGEVGPLRHSVSPCFPCRIRRFPAHRQRFNAGGPQLPRRDCGFAKDTVRPKKGRIQPAQAARARLVQVAAGTMAAPERRRDYGLCRE